MLLVSILFLATAVEALPGGGGRQLAWDPRAGKKCKKSKVDVCWKKCKKLEAEPMSIVQLVLPSPCTITFMDDCLEKKKDCAEMNKGKKKKKCCKKKCCKKQCEESATKKSCIKSCINTSDDDDDDGGPRLWFRAGERFSCRPLPGRDDAARRWHTTRSVTQGLVALTETDLRHGSGHNLLLYPLDASMDPTSDRGGDRGHRSKRGTP